MEWVCLSAVGVLGEKSRGAHGAVCCKTVKHAAYVQKHALPDALPLSRRLLAAAGCGLSCRWLGCRKAAQLDLQCPAECPSETALAGQCN